MKPILLLFKLKIMLKRKPSGKLAFSLPHIFSLSPSFVYLSHIYVILCRYFSPDESSFLCITKCKHADRQGTNAHSIFSSTTYINWYIDFFSRFHRPQKLKRILILIFWSADDIMVLSERTKEDWICTSCNNSWCIPTIIVAIFFRLTIFKHLLSHNPTLVSSIYAHIRILTKNCVHLFVWEW